MLGIRESHFESDIYYIKQERNKEKFPFLFILIPLQSRNLFLNVLAKMTALLFSVVRPDRCPWLSELFAPRLPLTSAETAEGSRAGNLWEVRRRHSSRAGWIEVPEQPALTSSQHKWKRTLKLHQRATLWCTGSISFSAQCQTKVLISLVWKPYSKHSHLIKSI